MIKAFPDAPLYTSLYDPGATFPEFASSPVVTLPLNRLGALRHNHRLALPLLAPAFSRLRIDADVVLCSSSGWAHGARTAGRKIVYCYTPARWLYDRDRYLGDSAPIARPALSAIRPWLSRWDRKAAASGHRYLTLSRVVRDRLWSAYGIEAEVVPPPHTIQVDGPSMSMDGIGDGFLLCVARLLPYKNVGALVRAFHGLPSVRLVVVGDGPERRRLEAGAPPNVSFLGSTSDAVLRGLYAASAGIIAAGHEDYGLTPLEGLAFGKPAAVLRWGGYLDTVVDGETGVFFDSLDPDEIVQAVTRLLAEGWMDDRLRAQAEQFSEARFVDRLRVIVAEEAPIAG